MKTIAMNYLLLAKSFIKDLTSVDEFEENVFLESQVILWILNIAIKERIRGVI